MIRITLQPEPERFDKEVRQKGLAELKRKNISLDQPLPPKTDLSPFWRVCLDDLYDSYQGICAYLCVHFERVTGGSSVDHFLAKSLRPDLAYEWANYRLASVMMNSRKRDYEDVFDPFEIETGWFRLELVSGRIYPDPALTDHLQEKIKSTIERLGLDKPRCRQIRARWFQEYIQIPLPSDYLKRYSPFVWYEAERQGLL